MLPAHTSSYGLQHRPLQLKALLPTSLACSSTSLVPAVLPKMAPESGMPKITHQQRNVNLFALAGRNAPKLDALQDLPTGMHLIGVGRPSDEVAGKCMPARACTCCPFDLLQRWKSAVDWTKADWAKVEVIFKCGTGKDAPTNQELQASSRLRPILGPTSCLAACCVLFSALVWQ